jgi:hypothetical protein
VKLCGYTISTFASGRGIAFPSKDTIAKGMGVTKRTADTAVNELQTSGFMVVVEGGGRSHTNAYQLLVPETVQPTAPFRAQTVQPVAPLAERNPAAGAMERCNSQPETLQPAAPESSTTKAKENAVADVDDFDRGFEFEVSRLGHLTTKQRRESHIRWVAGGRDADRLRRLVDECQAGERPAALFIFRVRDGALDGGPDPGVSEESARRRFVDRMGKYVRNVGFMDPTWDSLKREIHADAKKAGHTLTPDEDHELFDLYVESCTLHSAQRQEEGL